jgi:2-C-methyl-D-erythritol 4-phosphate cytidylyltransferase
MAGFAPGGRRGAGIVVAIVAAAGKGTRVGGAVPKQFLKVEGLTILEHTLTRLGRHPGVDAIVAVVPAARVAEVTRMKRRHPRLHSVVAGGARRLDSVARGLRAAPGGDRAVILVHDAARPLVDPAIVSAVIEGARRFGAAVPGLAPADTVKVVGGGGRVKATLDRARLRMIQTPQGFRASWLRKAFDATARPRKSATDDAALVEAAGMPVRVVEGDPMNFKVTTREDVARLRSLLRRRSCPSATGSASATTSTPSRTRPPPARSSWAA